MKNKKSVKLWMVVMLALTILFFVGLMVKANAEQAEETFYQCKFKVPLFTNLPQLQCPEMNLEGTVGIIILSGEQDPGESQTEPRNVEPSRKWQGDPRLFQNKEPSVIETLPRLCMEWAELNLRTGGGVVNQTVEDRQRWVALSKTLGTIGQCKY